MKSKHTFKKQYGQNFLRNSKFAEKMVTILDIQPDDIIIEIGPGEGVVTQMVLNRHPKLLISIEVDYQLLPSLVKRFNNFENFELVNQDILEVNFDKIVEQFTFDTNKEIFTKHLEEGKTVKYISSLPYNISKVIIQNALTLWPKASKMAFILQEEVALDYVASEPKGTFLGNWIRLFAKVKKHQSIPAKQFYPVPKVNGAIIEITPFELSQPQLEKVSKVERLLRLAFTQPRKTLRNNFKSSEIVLPEEILGKRASEINLVEYLYNVI